MANRAKRIAISERKEQNEALYRVLFKESDAYRAEQRQYREEDRQEARRFRRMINRGIPEWVLHNRGMVRLLEGVNQFRHNWVRTLYPWPWKESDSCTSLEALIPEWVFGKYPIPNVMKSVWLREDINLKLWYIHLAQGQNIRTAPGLPVRLTKRMAHLFLETPDHIQSVYHALRYAQVLALGGTTGLAESLMHSRMDFDPGRAAFWETLIHWLVNHQPMQEELVCSIVDYIISRKFRRMRIHTAEDGAVTIHALDSHFSMKGRTADKLISQVLEWKNAKDALTDGFENNNIVRSVGDLVFFTGGGRKPRVKYHLRPLLTPEEIIEEGRAMSHCVGSYAESVRRNYTSIWSLTEEAKAGRPRRMLTIELRSDAIISEVRGKGNRLATEFERTLVRRWASQQNLKWDETELRY